MTTHPEGWEWTTHMWFVPDDEGRIDLRRLFGYSTPINHYDVTRYENGHVIIRPVVEGGR